MNTSADTTCTKEYKKSLTGYLEGKGMEGAGEEDEGRLCFFFFILQPILFEYP